MELMFAGGGGGLMQEQKGKENSFFICFLYIAWFKRKKKYAQLTFQTPKIQIQTLQMETSAESVRCFWWPPIRKEPSLLYFFFLLRGRRRTQELKLHHKNPLTNAKQMF